MASPLAIATIMESPVQIAAPDLPPQALAEVFDRLIWCVQDNGEEVVRVRDAWLSGDDPRRISIALAMEETFPLDGAEGMRTQLARIATRWPQFAHRCAEIIAARASR